MPEIHTFALLSLCVAATATTQTYPAQAHPPPTLPRKVPAPLSATTKSLPLSEVFTRTATTTNCLGNAFEMPGQAWHTDLTGGGISLSTVGLDVRPPSFAGVYGFSPDQLESRPTQSEILIVDRFTPAPLNVQGAVLQLIRIPIKKPIM